MSNSSNHRNTSVVAAVILISVMLVCGTLLVSFNPILLGGSGGSSGGAGYSVGLTGAQGPQGIQGVKGDTGVTGSQGINGINGTNGSGFYLGVVAPSSPSSYALNSVYLNTANNYLYQNLNVSTVNYNTPAIVGTYHRGTASIASGTFTVTIPSPTSGNVLFLSFMGSGSDVNPNITGISQTNVVWTKVISINGIPNGYQDVETWKGVVSASAGTVVTLTVANGSGGTYVNVADIAEFTNISLVDQTAVNAGNVNNAGNSGTTAATTQTEELLLGAIGGSSGSVAVGQSGVTNSFIMLDGVNVVLGSMDTSLSMAYKIVSATGTANVATTFANTCYWSGVISTFKATVSSSSYAMTWVYQCAV